MKTRRLVITATIAALYTVLTALLNPMSFGPLQFRAANLLIALMLFDIDFCFGLALGVFFGNLTSPFGPLDWIVMPIISLVGALGGYYLRRYWYFGIAFWALITAAGIAIFPLGIGAHLPFIATFPAIIVAQVSVGVMGYMIFSPFKKILTHNQ